jgi:hypothetical protein
MLDDLREQGFSFLKIGGSVRVRESVLNEYLESCEVN